MKINLFALTGFGNFALQELLRHNVQIQHLYTRKEQGVFPYYKEKQLCNLAKEHNIETLYIPEDGSWDIKDEADLNLVVTFHRILHKNHRDKAQCNINIHPSLLPSYKGATPIEWMLYHQEKFCGISAHFMNEKVDDGELIYQQKYPLNVSTNGELRFFLAQQLPDAIDTIITSYPNFSTIQSPYKESYYPKFNYKEKNEN